MSQSDQFSGRMGLIFASIGAAIGTGNIWRFPRMVGANEGGTFLIPWLFFLFVWSIPLVIAEFALGKRSRTGTIGTFRIFAGKRFAWMGLWTAWISTAIGFYYAVVAGWCLKYFQLGVTNDLVGKNVDTQLVWNEFLQSSGQVIFYQFLVVAITLFAIWKGAKAIEKVNVILMCSLFVLLFMSLGLSLWMDLADGSLDGFFFMFTTGTMSCSLRARAMSVSLTKPFSSRTSPIRRPSSTEICRACCSCLSRNRYSAFSDRASSTREALSRLSSPSR